jgi:Fur family ferric uptake transcriptional regulator
MIDSFQDYLVENGLRMTAQRELIARTFFQNKGHISAEEIYRKVRSTSPGIGFATTYRTMKLLADAGLASLRSFGDGFSRYEPASTSNHHDHLICTQCGKIIEFENDRIEALQRTIAQKHGFQVTEHKMELYGICENCRG